MHPLMEQNTSARLQGRSFHNSHDRDIALGLNSISFENIAMDGDASGKINISYGVIHISRYNKDIFHLKSAVPEG